MANLILNSIQTPDGTVLTSYHRYDFVIHKDANGLRYFVDGGIENPRRSLHTSCPYHDLSVYDDDEFSKVREAFHWGTQGLQCDQQLQWIQLLNLETEYINNVLATKTLLPDYQRAIFEKELMYRNTVIKKR